MIFNVKDFWLTKMGQQNDTDFGSLFLDEIIFSEINRILKNG